jgi:hypothetical protein
MSRPLTTQLDAQPGELQHHGPIQCQYRIWIQERIGGGEEMPLRIWRPKHTIEYFRPG